MRRGKAIIFRCIVFSRNPDNTVSLLCDGVDIQLHNVSQVFDSGLCKASNKSDTFDLLVGTENKQALNTITRAALSAAAMATGADVSALDAFVLGEPELLAAVEERDLARVLDNAVAFGYTEAVKVLLMREPSAEAMRKALYSASDCGRLPALRLLYDAGASSNFKDDKVVALRVHGYVLG